MGNVQFYNMKKLLLLFLISFFSTPSLAEYEVIDDFYCEMTKFVTIYANKPTTNWKLERFKMEVEMDKEKHFADDNQRVVLYGGSVGNMGGDFIWKGSSDDFVAELEGFWSIEFENGILRVIERTNGVTETQVILAECL